MAAAGAVASTSDGFRFQPAMIAQRPDHRRVLFLLSSLRCQDGIAGHLAVLTTALNDRGWRVFFVAGHVDCPPETRPVLDAIQAACEQFAIDPHFSNTVKVTPWRLAKHVWRTPMWARRFGVRVVHLQNRALGPPTFAARLLGGPRRVFTKHLADPPRAERRRGRLAKIRGRLWCERAIAISGAMADDLTASDLIDYADIRYVAHGTNTAVFRRPTAAERQAARRSLDIAGDAFVCVQLARVADIKRPETLAAACALLRDEGRNVVALFAGFCEPAEADKLHAAARGRDDAFRVLGQRNARDVLWAADVKTLCSEREGFAVAIIEAMACGVVPIRTGVEGAADQIDDGVNGYLFDVGDVQQLAGILRTLHDDRARLHAVSLAAERTAAERFDARTMAEKTIGVYEELIARKPRDVRTLPPVKLRNLTG